VTRGEGDKETRGRGDKETRSEEAGGQEARLLFYLPTGMRRREAELGERAHSDPGAGLAQDAPA
jgi:hypothetical protein